jgi:HD-GYP domain-containing protein (c-di-GMP phosphodiesterase class II)
VAGSRQKSVASTPENLFDSLPNTVSPALRCLTAALQAHDPETARHTARVTHLSLRFAEALGLGAAQVLDVCLGALGHDVGKLFVRRDVLQKPAALSVEEAAVVRQHPTWGAWLLAGQGLTGSVLLVARHHHERWDGRGYPDGLARERIPLLARLVAITDAIDAMTTDRPYRRGVPWEIALVALAHCAGSQFDPSLVKAFLTAAPALAAGIASLKNRPDEDTQRHFPRRCHQRRARGAGEPTSPARGAQP